MTKLSHPFTSKAPKVNQNPFYLRQPALANDGLAILGATFLWDLYEIARKPVNINHCLIETWMNIILLL
jgi:hypothetical protein